MKPAVVHYKGCTAAYPEKPKDEAPKQITSFRIDKETIVHQCVDCGAFVLEPREETV